MITLSSGKMKEEHLNKLKQLDRIEYRQKEDRIKDWNNQSYGLIFLKAIILLIVLQIISLPLVYSAFGIDAMYNVGTVLGFGVGFFIPFALGGFGFDMLFSVIRNKSLSELKESYFKIEVKK